jgi:hypothetical protein
VSMREKPDLYAGDGASGDGYAATGTD